MSPVIIKPFEQLTVQEYHRIVEAREAIFYLEQHVTCADADATDPQSVFAWIEDNGCVAAFLRIIPARVIYPEASIGRVLTSKAYRRQGLCRQLMQHALNYITCKWGAQPVRISAQAYLTEFYTSLGFDSVSDLYLEAGIPHVKMLRSGESSE